MSKKEEPKKEELMPEAMATDNSNQETLGQETVKNTKFEFNSEHNMIFEEFSLQLGFVAKLSLLTAFIAIIKAYINFKSTGLLDSLIFIAGGLLCFFISYWHFRATRAFHRIVDTEGNDISFAMKALRSLQLYYRAFHSVIVGCVILACVYTVFTLIG